MRAALQQHIEEYISDSLVGSDDGAPTTKRVPPKVATSVPRHTRHTIGKMSASGAAATIVATQMAEAKKKKKRKRTGLALSADTATISCRIETINVRTRKMTPSRRARRRPRPMGRPARRCRWKSRRPRLPAGRRWWRSTPGRAPIHWATLGRRRGQGSPPEALQDRVKVDHHVSHETYTHSCFACSIRCASI
jgi:hypothetical protein